MAFKQRPALGFTFAVLATLLFGLNASTSKVLVQSGIDPSLLVLIRTASTALIAGVIVAATNPSALKIRRDEIAKFALFGVIGIAVMIWAYTESVSRIPVGITLLFEYTAIVMIPLASWFLFKERPARGLWTGVALVVAGMVIVGKIWNSTLDGLGVFFGLLCAVSVTVYFITGDRIQRRRDSFSTLFHAMWIASAFWLVVKRPGPDQFPDLTAMLDLGGNLAGSTVPTWLALIWLGTFGSFLPLFFAFAGLRHLSATVMGVVSTAETLFAFVFGFLWLGETIDGIQTIGGVLVISGILVTQLTKKQG